MPVYVPGMAAPPLHVFIANGRSCRSVARSEFLRWKRAIYEVQGVILESSPCSAC
jgi:hypothetical protein